MSNEVEVQETLNDQLQVRREKMHQLREKGVEPFQQDLNKNNPLKKFINNLKVRQKKA